MDEASLGGITSLLGNFRLHREETQAEKYKALAEGLSRMRAGLEPIREQFARDEIVNASHFNIFSMLGVQHNEVTTHSRFLYELLRPEGSHCQRMLFLTKFLEMLAERDEEFLMPELPLRGEWQVEREKRVGYGILDLVILGRKAETLVVIENKIWAKEGDIQLERYAAYMKTMKAACPNQALIYLTPDGEESVTANMERYLALAYKPDIVNWLEECLPEVKSPRVSHTIQQYLDIIREFSGGRMDYKQEAIDLIKRPENIEASLEIAGLVEALKPQFQKIFWEDVAAKTESLLLISELANAWRVGSPKKSFDQKNLTLAIFPREKFVNQHFLLVALQQDEISTGYRLCYGIGWDQLFPEGRQLSEYEELRKELTNQGFIDEDWWPGRKYLDYAVWKKEFLLRMGTDRDAFIEEMASLLINLLKVNLDMINAVNAALRQPPYLTASG